MLVINDYCTMHKKHYTHTPMYITWKYKIHLEYSCFIFFILHHTSQSHQFFLAKLPNCELACIMRLLFGRLSIFIFISLLLLCRSSSHMKSEKKETIFDTWWLFKNPEIRYGMWYFFFLDMVNRRFEPSKTISFAFYHHLWLTNYYFSVGSRFFLHLTNNWQSGKPQNCNLQFQQTIVFQLYATMASKWARETMVCEIIYYSERWTH